MERGRLFQRRRVCRFCHDSTPLDYKDAGLLRNFLTERGRIIPRDAHQEIAYGINDG